jgi:hypothetical protein
VANAVRNLWRNIGAYGSSLVSYVASGGKRADGRTDGGEPITGRDLIALLATIGIDLGLLALAIINPPREGPSLRPTLALRTRINEAIDTAISRAGVTREWVHRHFIHHRDASYLVIPNLYAADPADEAEAARALAMNHLAGVLTDLGLVRWPKRNELAKLRKEEGLGSDTDLEAIRKKWAQDHRGQISEVDKGSGQELRNHGLFSKAERALQTAGWSERARRDVEIYPIAAAEGLTPLLMVLNDGRGAREPAQPAHA